MTVKWGCGGQRVDHECSRSLRDPLGLHPFCCPPQGHHGPSLYLSRIYTWLSSNFGFGLYFVTVLYDYNYFLKCFLFKNKSPSISDAPSSLFTWFFRAGTEPRVKSERSENIPVIEFSVLMLEITFVPYLPLLLDLGISYIIFLRFSRNSDFAVFPL